MRPTCFLPYFPSPRLPSSVISLHLIGAGKHGVGSRGIGFFPATNIQTVVAVSNRVAGLTTYFPTHKILKEMTTSEQVFTFTMSVLEKQTLLNLQEWPWSVFQVVPTTPEKFDDTVATCKKRGFVAYHDTDRTFCIIHLCSGDQNGKFPEHHVEINSKDQADEFFQTLKDAMSQAAMWYYANVIAQ